MKGIFTIILVFVSAQAFAVTTKIDCTGQTNSGLYQFEIKGAASAGLISEIQFWSYNQGAVSQLVYQNGSELRAEQVEVDAKLISEYAAPHYELSGSFSVSGPANRFVFGADKKDSRGGRLDLILDGTFDEKVNKGYAASLNGDVVQYDLYDSPSYVTPVKCSVFGE